jgi:hypothetical protein
VKTFSSGYITLQKFLPFILAILEKDFVYKFQAIIGSNHHVAPTGFSLHFGLEMLECHESFVL